MDYFVADLFRDAHYTVGCQPKFKQHYLKYPNFPHAIIQNQGTVKNQLLHKCNGCFVNNNVPAQKWLQQ